MISQKAHNRKKQQLIRELQKARRAKGYSIGLKKKTSNLFRDRQQKKTKKIDVKRFNNVIDIDPIKKIANVEGMTTYEEFVRETLRYGLLPPVVPELKSITIGGAISGGGIESSSFKYGFVHETILEIEVLLGDGTTIICTKNKNKDLFYGFANSYGTYGYILRLKVKLVPAKRYVKLTHHSYSDAKLYFKDIKKFCEQKKRYDFIDGTIFNEKESYITLASFVDKAPFLSNYKYMNIYYRSIRRKKTDYLTAKDYIWRWDTDWFWCSKHFFVQNPFVRAAVGLFVLKSTVYWQIMNFDKKYHVIDRLNKITGKSKPESVVQDVQIPIENCEKFLDFFHNEIRIKPIWVCPAQAVDKKARYSLYLTNPSKLYVNFGFWDGVPTTKEEGYYNKKIENKVKQLKGKKSLYSLSYFSKAEFWRQYNKKAYDKLKKKYDPSRTFRDLYEKCVKRQ